MRILVDGVKVALFETETYVSPPCLARCCFLSPVSPPAPGDRCIPLLHQVNRRSEVLPRRHMSIVSGREEVEPGRLGQERMERGHLCHRDTNVDRCPGLRMTSSIEICYLVLQQLHKMGLRPSPTTKAPVYSCFKFAYLRLVRRYE